MSFDIYFYLTYLQKNIRKTAIINAPRDNPYPIVDISFICGRCSWNNAYICIWITKYDIHVSITITGSIPLLLNYLSPMAYLLLKFTVPKYVIFIKATVLLPHTYVTLADLYLYVCFVDRCLSFCTFSFSHCVVCSSSIYGFWFHLWYLQTLLTYPV